MKQIQKLVETKQKHYEKFLKVFKDDIKGCNIKFEEGEKEAIMKNYIKEFHSPKSKSGNISNLNDVYIDDSTGANTESVKYTKCLTGKRNRPQTVNKTRARNTSNLYVIEEKSPKILKRDKNQKSTAYFRRNDNKNTNKSDLFNSGSKSHSRRKNELESEIHLSTQISKSKPANAQTRKQFDFDVGDTYIDPDKIKAYTGKSDGIK